MFIPFRHPGFLVIGLFFILRFPASATLPLTHRDVILMLRSGFSKTEVSQEIAARKVLEPLTDDLQKQLVSAGADKSLLAVYLQSQLKGEDADQARGALAERQVASDTSRAKALQEIEQLPPITNRSPSVFMQQIQADLITANAQKYTPSLAKNRFIAIYFSASWCGPCKRFTPDLVTFYHTLKKEHSDFELVFVSLDKDEKAMLSYMTEDQMPWPALSYRAEKSAKAAVAKFAGNGIPNLVLLDANGQVLSQSYRNGEYVGPREVLRDWVALYKN